MSAGPPAANGTTMRTGFVGYVCADAASAPVATTAASVLRTPCDMAFSSIGRNRLFRDSNALAGSSAKSTRAWDCADVEQARADKNSRPCPLEVPARAGHSGVYVHGTPSTL